MADCATVEYVQVDIDSGTSIDSSTITDWLSILIEFSILGPIIGIVNKTGR